MSTLVLSLLLLLLIAAGMLMAKPVREHFVSELQGPQMKVSPTLLNMVATPDMNKPRVNVDTLARETDLQRGSTDNIWANKYKGRRANCLALDHNKGFRVDDVSGCMNECALNDECNTFNYDTDASPSCFLQSCPNLPNIPLMQDKFPNSSVWYKKGGKPAMPPLGPGEQRSGTGTAVIPSDSPYPVIPSNIPNPVIPSDIPRFQGQTNRVPIPDQGDEQRPTCPDMSQYIRLDEIPCWNCSLP